MSKILIHRRAYHRKSYTRKSGIYVKPAFVKSTSFLQNIRKPIPVSLQRIYSTKKWKKSEKALKKYREMSLKSN